MKANASSAMNAAKIVVCAAIGTSLSACAPAVALIPLGVGASFIAFDGSSHGGRNSASAPMQPAQDLEAANVAASARQSEQ